jgi:hypothetical protein
MTTVGKGHKRGRLAAFVLIAERACAAAITAHALVAVLPLSTLAPAIAAGTIAPRHALRVVKRTPRDGGLAVEQKQREQRHRRRCHGGCAWLCRCHGGGRDVAGWLAAGRLADGWLAAAMMRDAMDSIPQSALISS